MSDLLSGWLSAIYPHISHASLFLSSLSLTCTPTCKPREAPTYPTNGINTHTVQTKAIGYKNIKLNVTCVVFMTVKFFKFLHQLFTDYGLKMVSVYNKICLSFSQLTTQE